MLFLQYIKTELAVLFRKCLALYLFPEQAKLCANVSGFNQNPLPATKWGLGRYAACRCNLYEHKVLKVEIHNPQK